MRILLTSTCTCTCTCPPCANPANCAQPPLPCGKCGRQRWAKAPHHLTQPILTTRYGDNDTQHNGIHNIIFPMRLRSQTNPLRTEIAISKGPRTEVCQSSAHKPYTRIRPPSPRIGSAMASRESFGVGPRQFRNSPGGPRRPRGPKHPRQLRSTRSVSVAAAHCSRMRGFLHGCRCGPVQLFSNSSTRIRLLAPWCVPSNRC